MNVRKLMLTVILLAATALTQSTTPQTPPPGSQGQTGADPSTSTQHEHGQPATGTSRSAMRMQHMQQARADLERMKALLSQMRATYGSMDPKNQPAMQANIELWQLMINHMDQMISHMEQMGGMGTMGHDMMHHGRSGQSTPPPTKP
ncbi:MAG: hypothetical protein ACE14L_10945 [Terriglobales bacterium]